MRLVEKLTGVSITESTYEWAGNGYSNFLIPGEIEISPALSVRDKLTKTHGIGDNTHEFSFISPKSYEIQAIIDGTALLNVKFGLETTTGGSSADSRITKIEVKIVAVDADGDERTIIPYFTMWSGTLESEWDDGGKSRAALDWINFSDVTIRGDERIKTYFKYTSDSHDGSYEIYLYCNPDSTDLMIQMPFVMG